MPGYNRLLLITSCLVLSPTACSLNLTRVKGGVLQHSLGKAFRQAAHADLFIIIDSDSEADDRSSIAEMIHITADRLRSLVQQFDGSSHFGQLVRRRIDNLEHGTQVPQRQKRGLINLIGEATHYLFGIARQSDTDRLGRAIDALRTQTSSIATLQGKQIVAINALAENQREIADHLTDIRVRIKQQQDQLQQMGRILEEEARHLHHVDMRQRITLLVDNFADDAAALHAVTSATQRRRNLCESRLVTEDLLPRRALQDVLDNPINDGRIPIDWFYAHLKVESMFITNNTLVCKIVIPFVHDETYNAYSIVTMPTPNINMSGFLHMYHDAQVAISTASDEMMFVHDCIGTNPRVCPGAPRFPIKEFPCIQGILDNNVAKQHNCPITYLKTRREDNVFKRLGINVYVGYIEATDYYYRCSKANPLFGRLDASPYLIELDADCTLDAGSFVLSGIPATSANFGFEQPRIRVVEIPVLEEAPIRNLTQLIRDFPHIEELKVARITDIRNDELLSQLGIMKINSSRHDRWFNNWWFWVALVGVAASGLFVIIRLLRWLRSRRPNQPSGSRGEEAVIPLTDIPQPRNATSSLYPPLPSAEVNP